MILFYKGGGCAGVEYGGRHRVCGPKISKGRPPIERERIYDIQYIVFNLCAYD